MRQIFIAVNNRDPKNPDATVADGMMEIDDDADVLTAVKKKYPNAVEAVPHEENSPVYLVKIKND